MSLWGQFHDAEDAADEFRPEGRCRFAEEEITRLRQARARGRRRRCRLCLCDEHGACAFGLSAMPPIFF